MEGKNKFNTYVVSFNYPSSYSSVFLRLRSLMYDMNFSSIVADEYGIPRGFAPIFPDTCYHLTHYWLAAVDIPVASDNPVHYADAIRYNARTPLQGSLLPLTRLVWA